MNHQSLFSGKQNISKCVLLYLLTLHAKYKGKGKVDKLYTYACTRQTYIGFGGFFYHQNNFSRSST